MNPLLAQLTQNSKERTGTAKPQFHASPLSDRGPVAALPGQGLAAQMDVPVQQPQVRPIGLNPEDEIRPIGM